MEHSYFRNDYFKEKNLSLLDNLNKLYVAMTRSRERLYIFSKFFPENIASDFSKKGNLNSFLYAFSDTYPIITGDANYQHISELNIKSTFKVTPRNKLDWRDIISLKHSAEELWDIESQNEKKDWGKLLHKVLADIHYQDQKDEIIDQEYKMGKCSKRFHYNLFVFLIIIIKLLKQLTLSAGTARTFLNVSFFVVVISDPLKNTHFLRNI